MDKRRDGEGDGQMSLIDVVLLLEKPGRGLFRLLGQGRLDVVALGQIPHESAHRGHDIAIAHVTHHHHGKILGMIMVLHIVENIVPGKSGDALHRADNRQPIGMDGVGRGHQLLEELGLRPVVTHADLFKNDLFLPFKLLRVEGGIAHRIRQHVKAPFPETGGEGGVVHRVFIGGIGIDAAAHLLDVAGDPAQPPGGGAFEDHMLDQVGDAALVFVFINTAGLDPELHGGDLCPRCFLHQHR